MRDTQAEPKRNAGQVARASHLSQWRCLGSLATSNPDIQAIDKGIPRVSGDGKSWETGLRYLGLGT